MSRERGSSLLEMLVGVTILSGLLAGVELAPPLTDASIRDVLTGVEVTVAVRSTSPLRDGTFYQTSAQQRVALRNLSFNR